MNTGHTIESLKAFEERVKTAFLDKHIKAPIHLSGGNEGPLLEIFPNIQEEDWVLSTWRSHYHALLKGVPETVLFQAILEGRSMYFQDAEHRFLTSAIVGGIMPIAVGVALGIKRRGGSEHVWAFIGDMAAESGIAHECIKYAARHWLKLDVVIEDNGLSTNTPTQKVWGDVRVMGYDGARRKSTHTYKYSRQWPHTGVGQWVSFG